MKDILATLDVLEGAVAARSVTPGMQSALEQVKADLDARLTPAQREGHAAAVAAMQARRDAARSNG